MTPAAEPPLLANPVLGWRLFRVVLDETESAALASLYSDELWPTEPNVPLEARCRPPFRQAVDPNPHRSPGVDCQCGVHAYYERERAAGRRPGHQPHAVLGAVACWGRVIPHPDDFRAERALLLGLHDPLGRPSAVAVALRLGIPLAVEPAALESEALEHAQPFPRRMIPEGPPAAIAPGP